MLLYEIYLHRTTCQAGLGDKHICFLIAWLFFLWHRMLFGRWLNLISCAHQICSRKDSYFICEQIQCCALCRWLKAKTFRMRLLLFQWNFQIHHCALLKGIKELKYLTSRFQKALQKSTHLIHSLMVKVMW